MCFDPPGRLEVEQSRGFRESAGFQRILDLIAEGKTNRQIAEQMYLAEKTVKNYVSGLLRKLGMERRPEAAVYALGRRQRRT